jgi:hypothetical protein
MRIVHVVHYRVLLSEVRPPTCAEAGRSTRKRHGSEDEESGKYECALLEPDPSCPLRSWPSLSGAS